MRQTRTRVITILWVGFGSLGLLIAVRSVAVAMFIHLATTPVQMTATVVTCNTKPLAIEMDLHLMERPLRPVVDHHRHFASETCTRHSCAISTLQVSCLLAGNPPIATGNGVIPIDPQVEVIVTVT